MLDRAESAQETDEKRELLDLIASRCAPGELRDLAGTMLRLADALDQSWSSQPLSSFGWLTEARRIERNAYNLATRAKREQERRALRNLHISSDLLGEPAWDMLLELFCQFAGGAKVSIKSLTIASGEPASTALRTIDRLVESGLVSRTDSHIDGRVVLLGLTREGVVSVGRALEKTARPLSD